MSYTPEQRQVIDAISRQGRKHGATRREILAAYETALTEAALRNPKSATDHDSLGAFQQRPSMGWGSAAQVTNPDYAAAKFFQTAKGERGHGFTASQLSQAVQRSAFPERYKQHQGEGVDLVHQFYDKANPAIPKPAKAVTGVKGVTPPSVIAPDPTARKALLAGYLQTRGQPNALLNLASGLNTLKAQQAAVPAVKTTAPKTAQKAASSVPDTSGFQPVKAGETYSGTDGRKWKITPQAAPYLVRFDGEVTTKPIAALLTQARKMGWKGKLTLGYRSYDHQYDIYYRQGIRPAAVPGTSKHEQFKGSTAGAIDVTNAQQLGQILSRVKGNFLTWAGAKDPPHLSHQENGRY